jgi:hypothetical protein
MPRLKTPIRRGIHYTLSAGISPLDFFLSMILYKHQDHSYVIGAAIITEIKYGQEYVFISPPVG